MNNDICIGQVRFCPPRAQDGWLIRVHTNNRVGGYQNLVAYEEVWIRSQIVLNALLVRMQCFRTGLCKAVLGANTKPIVLSMINKSYCRRT